MSFISLRCMLKLKNECTINEAEYETCVWVIFNSRIIITMLFSTTMLGYSNPIDNKSNQYWDEIIFLSSFVEFQQWLGLNLRIWNMLYQIHCESRKYSIKSIFVKVLIYINVNFKNKQNYKRAKLIFLLDSTIFHTYQVLIDNINKSN